jgi:hypothetical protein
MLVSMWRNAGKRPTRATYVKIKCMRRGHCDRLYDVSGDQQRREEVQPDDMQEEVGWIAR